MFSQAGLNYVIFLLGPILFLFDIRMIIESLRFLANARGFVPRMYSSDFRHGEEGVTKPRAFRPLIVCLHSVELVNNTRKKWKLFTFSRQTRNYSLFRTNGKRHVTKLESFVGEKNNRGAQSSNYFQLLSNFLIESFPAIFLWAPEAKYIVDFSTEAAIILVSPP